MRALLLALCLSSCAAPRGEPTAPREVSPEVLHASAPIEGTRLAHGPVVERWSRLPSGLEHTFELPDRASVPGAFRFEPPGGTFLGADARGVRYRTSQGTFWYSHGQLIDATGARTHVPARWNQGAIELAISPELTLGAQYPALLDPSLGPEREIAQPLARPALRVERSGSAFGPRGGIVVWLDEDADTPRARATALEIDGRPREPTYDLGVAWDVNDLAVAAGADGFVAAWSTFAGTRVLRLAGDGRPSGGDFTVPGAHCAITATRRGYLLVTGGPTALDLYQLDANAAPSTRRVLAAGADYPRVACTETVCLVVWSDTRTWALRVTPAGRVLDAAPFSLSERATRAGVASDGERFLVGWQDGWQIVHSDGALGARGAVVDAEP
ncbi:MAG: hypothetical protein K8H88_08340, partial [Sandaracinaceae bacterium]|nr:hypothetical protein [Sandaracinaceae bacterium]